MPKLLRSPLTWIVSAEIVVVGTLVIVAWSVVAGAARPVLLSPTITLPDATAGDPNPLPGFPDLSGAPPRGPQPGLNVSSRFWRDRLLEMNREEAFLARLEWRIVHGVMDAVKRYLETVVLPAVRKAEHPTRR